MVFAARMWHKGFSLLTFNKGFSLLTFNRRSDTLCRSVLSEGYMLLSLVKYCLFGAQLHLLNTKVAFMNVLKNSVVKSFGDESISLEE